MYALVQLACFAPLVDERVIGVDVPAEESFGPADSRLGTTVAGGLDGWAATGAGFVRVDGVDTADRVFAGWWDDRLVTADARGDWWVDGAPQVGLPGARRWAAGPAGVAVWDGSTLRLPDGSTVPVTGLGSLAVGEGAVYGVVCGDACEAVAWMDGAERARWAAGEGGAVAEWGGVAWAGDPMAEADTGTGRVCSAEDVCVEGLPGDHLGSSVGGGYAGGTFNKWIVPARARFLPLDGAGPVYALEVGAENQVHALGGDAEVLLVGAPYQPHEGGPAGMVARVPR